jgi:hypothetical protein
MRDPLTGRYADATVALLLGLAATLVALAAAAWWRRSRPEDSAPVAGLALAAAGTAGIAARLGDAAGLAAGLAVLAGAGTTFGWWADRTRSGAVGVARAGVRLALVAAGVLLMTRAGDRQLALPWPVLVLAVAGAGALLADFDRHWRRRGLAPVLLAVTSAGIYLVVPDVEAALMVLGAALPTALLGWPGPLGRSRAGPAAVRPPSIGGAGSYAVAGLLVWTAATGGAGRPGAFVGALACLGVLVVEPLARQLHRGGRPLGPIDGRWVAWSVLGAQLVLVAVAARVVGRPASVTAALALAALQLGVALAAVTAISRSYGKRTAA